MSYYVYKIYTTKQEYVQTLYDSGSSSDTGTYTGGTSYSLNPSTGVYSVSGSGSISPGTSNTIYSLVSGKLEAETYGGSSNTISRSLYSSTLQTVKGNYYGQSVYDGSLSDGANENGYWYERYSYVPPPSAPSFTQPTAGNTVTGAYSIKWGAVDSYSGDPITYEVDLSLNGGSTYHSIANNVSGTQYDYNFSAETDTSNAKLRIRAYDGYQYGAYGYSGTFTISATGGGSYQMML